MKRLFPLIAILMLLCACTPSYDILSYQDSYIRAECQINDEFLVTITKDGGIRELVVTKPEELCGIAFRGEGEAWVMELNEVEIPTSASSLDGICALCSIFDLSESAITTAKDESGDGIVSFDMERGLYVVTYNKMALPERVKITSADFSYDVRILSIDKEK
ncbi:MAG: hypothetical protein IJF11_02970 [Clostridia bacterium]|nr:hypothetical protein [Clostridia bacterium]